MIRAAEIARQRAAYRQRLNPRSRFEGTDLSRPGGLERVGVSIAWLKPGEESFVFHAHMVEEEWLYVLSGRAVVEMGDESVEVVPGDFVAFPAPNMPAPREQRLRLRMLVFDGRATSGCLSI